MAGNKIGAIKARDTILKKYGEDYFRVNGKRGGTLSRGGGFAHPVTGKALAQLAGAKGGKKSRRTGKITMQFKGKEMTLSDIARKVGVSYQTIRYRYHNGRDAYGNGIK